MFVNVLYHFDQGPMSSGALLQKVYKLIIQSWWKYILF